MLRKQYFCVCEGQQESLYFKRLGKLMSNPPKRVIKFNTVVDNPSRLAREYIEMDSAAVFDFDFNDAAFRNNIKLCDKLKGKYKTKKQATNRNIYHAFSNVNFDLWLLIHKVDYRKKVYNNHSYTSDLRVAYGLKKDADIKNLKIINTILGQISLNDVKMAVLRAKKIRQNKILTDAITVEDSLIYDNPDFSIHQFVDTIIKEIEY